MRLYCGVMEQQNVRLTVGDKAAVLRSDGATECPINCRRQGGCIAEGWSGRLSD